MDVINPPMKSSLSVYTENVGTRVYLSALPLTNNTTNLLLQNRDLYQETDIFLNS